MVYRTHAEAREAAKVLLANRMSRKNARWLVCATEQGFRLWPGMNFADIDAKPRSYRTVEVIG